MTQPDETPRGLPPEEPATADPGDVDRIRDAIRPFAEVSMIAEWINRACCERLVAWDVDNAVLWKLLRHLCTHLVDVMTVDGVTVRVYTPQSGAHGATEYDTGTATVHQLRLVADGHADIPLWRQGVWIEAGALVILLLASIRLGSKRGG